MLKRKGRERKGKERKKQKKKWNRKRKERRRGSSKEGREGKGRKGEEGEVNEAVKGNGSLSQKALEVLGENRSKWSKKKVRAVVSGGVVGAARRVVSVAMRVRVTCQRGNEPWRSWK
jgi:hypothetical protein